MRKKYWFLIALVLFLLFSLEVYEYFRVIGEKNEASAVTVGIPNPGHAWLTMECSSNTLCIDTANNYVGIGTNTPAAKLDVNGGIRVGNQTTCNSSSAGTIRYVAGTGMQFCVASGGWSTFVVAPAPTECPAGATCSTIGSDMIIKWMTVGSYTWIVPSGVSSVSYLVVAGGGGGGLGTDGGGGGGGGGGVLSGTLIATTSTVSVAVGSGGSARANGTNSTFSTIVAVGGGHGGDSAGNVGASGGSGGGGGHANSQTQYAGGTGTSGQGNNGGYGYYQGSGGGGGAGGVGGNGSNPTQTTTGGVGGNGGAGISNNITGVATYYGGGGGGSSYYVSVGNGGLGGGGASGVAGTSNTGGGGGAGAAGGSGIVIVRYTVPQ